MESAPALPSPAIQTLSLVIGFAIIIVPLIFVIAWLIISSRNKKIVIETSILLKKLAVLNAEYFPGENSTNREFQKNLHYAAYSRKTFDAYQEEITQLKSEITAEEAERLHISLEKYRIIEQTLFDKRVFCLPGEAPKGQFVKKLYRLKKFIPLLVVLAVLAILYVKQSNLKPEEKKPTIESIMSYEEEDALEEDITKHLKRVLTAGVSVSVHSGYVWSDTSAVKEKTAVNIFVDGRLADTVEEGKKLAEGYYAAMTLYFGERDIDDYDIYFHVSGKYVFLNGELDEIKN